MRCSQDVSKALLIPLFENNGDMAKIYQKTEALKCLLGNGLIIYIAQHFS